MDPDLELGLREQKKRATHAALQVSALELVAQHGVEQVTVEEITAKVGVSPRTFFNYFATKVDALIDADPYRLEISLQRLAARPENESPLASMRAILLQDAPRVEQAKETWRLRLALGAKHPEVFHAAASAGAKFDYAIARAIANRLGHDVTTSPIPRLVTGVATVARRTALHVWAHGDFAEPYPEVLNRCFDELRTLLPTVNE